MPGTSPVQTFHSCNIERIIEPQKEREEERQRLLQDEYNKKAADTHCLRPSLLDTLVLYVKVWTKGIPLLMARMVQIRNLALDNFTAVSKKT
jgi:hypothetical protein